MVSHVLAIYRPTVTGDRVLRRARALVAEHGARLTVAIITDPPGRPGGCSVSEVRWAAIMSEETTRDFERARRALGSTGAHLAEVEGGGLTAIAVLADRLGCDLVLLPVGGRLRTRWLVHALRRRTTASVVAVGRR